MKKYLAFILLFFGIGCICSCTAIDELGDTSCVPEGMVRVEVPLSVAPPTQKAEGITRGGVEAPEAIENLIIKVYGYTKNLRWERIYFDSMNSANPRFPVIPTPGGGQTFSLKLEMPKAILQDMEEDKLIVTVEANTTAFRDYGSTETNPPLSSPVYMSGIGVCYLPVDGSSSSSAEIILKRSICKLATVVRVTDRSVLGDWQVDVPETEVQLLHVPLYARKFDPDLSLVPGPPPIDLNPGYTDPGYGDYESKLLKDFSPDNTESLTWSYQGGESNTATGYVQYFFENYLKNSADYAKGVNTTTLRVKIPLHNTDTNEDKFIEREILVGTSGMSETALYNYILQRNTAYLLDIQVLSAEDIKVDLHLQDWWREEIIDGDIPGINFTVDKTEVPVIPYGVKDPAPAFKVVPHNPAFLDIALVDKNKNSVDQTNGFVLWYKTPVEASLTQAPAGNRIQLHVNNSGLQVFFTTVKNGNPGGFFCVSCGKSTRYIPISTPKYVRMDEIFNKTMTSNCYIAEKEGGYRFAGTVMGNGTDGLPPAVQVSMHPYNADGYLTGTPLNPSIAPKSAKLLWQDVDGLITQVGFDQNTTSRGDVVFYVSGAKGPGNAVISVYDTEDPNASNARVLWSWHIWCAPRPEEMSTSGSSAMDEGGKRIYTFMDRNLGATTADGSDKGAQGMVYRFGRNVPMVHFDKAKIYNILGTDITSRIVWGESPAGNDRPAIPWDNILFPLHYYTGRNSNGHSGMWGEGVMEVVPNYDDKTIYDPCPVGYKVPTFNAFLALKGLYYPDKRQEKDSGIYFTGLRGGTLCFPWVDRFMSTPNNDGQWDAISFSNSNNKFLQYYSASILTVASSSYPPTIKTFNLNSTMPDNVSTFSTYLLPVRCVREREKE